LKKIEELIARIEKVLAVFFLSVIILSVALQVLARYILPVPVPWTEELSRYSLIWLTFVGAAMAIHSKGHFVLEVVLNRFSPRIKYGIELCLLLLIAVFLVINTYSSVLVLDVLQYQTSAALQMPMSYVYLSIPTGSVLMLIHVLVHLSDLLTNRATHICN
jgi:TRAP-type C4-dicarboxylate transport system permease small subunit